MALRATLHDPEGFDHIVWMIRLFGFLGAAARFRPRGYSIMGIGRVVQ
jgi:hypothetical protein